MVIPVEAYSNKYLLDLNMCHSECLFLDIIPIYDVSVSKEFYSHSRWLEMSLTSNESFTVCVYDSSTQVSDCRVPIMLSNSDCGVTGSDSPRDR